MKRKIIKVGNSLAMTLPPELLQELGWRDGTHVDVQADTKRRRFVITKAKKRE